MFAKLKRSLYSISNYFGIAPADRPRNGSTSDPLLTAKVQRAGRTYVYRGPARKIVEWCRGLSNHSPDNPKSVTRCSLCDRPSTTIVGGLPACDEHADEVQSRTAW